MSADLTSHARGGVLGWVLLVALGCGDSSSPGGLGNIEVRTETTGGVADPDGYQVTVDDEQLAAVAATGAVTISSVPAGSRSVRLVGVADHCTAGGDNPRLVEVGTGETATTAFSVTCGTPTGSVQVQVTTTGEDIDEDGYTILANGQGQVVAANGEVVFSGLPAGTETVEVLIDGIAPNCLLLSEGQFLLSVPAGGQAEVEYILSCVGPLLNDFAISGTEEGDDGPLDIFRLNANGTQVRNLTMSPELETAPSWSPDGSRIAFSRSVSNETHVFVMNADGTNLVDLNVSLGNPTWSPDGTKLAADDNLNIFIFNSDGTGLTNITNKVNIPGAEDAFGNPAWSPDGTRIVYSGNISFLPDDCFVINIDGTGDTMVKAQCSSPAWSPVGNRIALNSRGRVLTMAPDGSDVVDLTLVEDPLVDAAPAWSPDGGRIAFLSSRSFPEDPSSGGGIPNILVMNVDGTGVRAVTRRSQFGRLIGGPTWGPALP